MTMKTVRVKPLGKMCHCLNLIWPETALNTNQLPNLVNQIRMPVIY